MPINLSVQFPITEPLVKRDFQKVIQAELASKSFLQRFMASNDAPIITDVLAGKNGYIQIPFVQESSDKNIIIGDAYAKGREKKINFLYASAMVSSFTVAYDVRTPLERMFGFELEKERTLAKDQLAQDMALVRDITMFRELQGINYATLPETPETPTNTYVFGGNFGQTANNVTNTSVATVDDIRNLRRVAINGNKTAGIPPIKPFRTIRIKVSEVATLEMPIYVLLATSATISQLKEDAQWNSAVVSGLERGWANPYFSGAVGMIDGIVIYETPEELTDGDGAIIQAGLATGTNGSSVPYTTALLLGKNALGWREDPVDYREWVEESKFPKIAGDKYFACKRLKFKELSRYPDGSKSIFANKDCGVIVCYGYNA